MLDSAELQADFARSRDGYFFLVETFRGTLPEPPKETPEMRRKRLKAAIAAVASLCPVGLAEAGLAARHVAADQQASECLRLINQLHHNLPKQMQCRAQSISMARQSDTALRSLLRLQAMRMKRDAKPETADAAVWAEHIAAEAMMAALEPEVPNGQAAAPHQPEEAVAAEAETPEVAVAEVAPPARAAFPRPGDLPTVEELNRALMARLSQVDRVPAPETQSQFS